MYMCVYMCMYACVHLCVYTVARCVYASTCYVHVYMCVCACVCVCARVCMCVYAHTCYVCACICCVYAWIHVCVDHGSSYLNLHKLATACCLVNSNAIATELHTQIFNTIMLQWCCSFCSILQTKFDVNFRCYSSEDGKKVYAVSIYPTP